MAIVNSLGIGKSVKSAGNLTYKTVRGRTIASQRIISNKSNTMKQSIQRTHFRLASQAAQLIQVFIDNCYEKSKYGSARNAFMHLNKSFIADGVVSEVREGAIPLVDVFVPAFSQIPGGTESPINYSAYGTSPVITQETVTTVDYTDSAENMLEFRRTEDVKFTFLTPMKKEDVEIVCVHLTGPLDTHLLGIYFKTLVVSLSDTDLPKLTALGFTVTPELDDNGNVMSVEFVSADRPADTIKTYAVAFPRVGGKIPKLRGLLVGGSAE